MEGKKILRRIITEVIFVIISIIALSKFISVVAVDMSVGQKVTTTKLWKNAKYKGTTDIKVYCTDHTHHFYGANDYKVTEKWTVLNRTVKKNGVVVSELLNNPEWKVAVKRAYILSKNITDESIPYSVVNNDKFNEGHKDALLHGIYSVLNYRQEALWKAGTGSWNWKKDGEIFKLCYSWDLGTGKEDYNIIESGSKYAFASDEHWFNGVDIGTVKFGNTSNNYYQKASDLYDEAAAYNGYTIGTPTVYGSTEPDYSAEGEYVIIRKYRVTHSSNVSLDAGIVAAYDMNDSDIKDLITVDSKNLKTDTGVVCGTEITIKAKKSNLPTSIKNIKLSYTAKNIVDATFYIIERESSQTLISGSGSIKNVTGYMELTPNITLIPPAKITLTKASSLGGNLSGAEFNVVAKQESETLESTTITTTGGKATFVCQPKSRDKDVVITITENTAPTASGGIYKKLNKTMVITLTYDTTTNKWKATKTTDDENVLDITNNTNIDLTITNQYISPIKIGGNIEGFGGFNKVDQAGNPVIGAEFEAVYIQDGKEIFRETVKSDATGKLDFSKVQPETTSNVTVTIEETKAPSGYSKKDYKHTIVFKYGKDGEKVEDKHTWVPISDDTVRVKYKDGMTYVDTDDVENESKIDQLQLLKSNSQNEEKLVGAQFKITLENIKSYEGNSTDATSEDGKLVIYATTTNDGILLKDLVIKDVTNPVIITLEETLAPVGYKKIEGTITLTITRVGTKYTIVTSADESVVNDEFEADVVKIKPGDNGILKGDVNKNGILDAGDALLILKNSVGKYDFDEELKKIADVNGDNAVNSADAKWILDNKTPIPNSGSTIGLGGKGDVNGDGKITEADAEEILKYSVNLITDLDLEKADVDGNGVVNSADALRILKFIAGEKEGATGNVTEESNVITIRMSDIPIMNLGGIVWYEDEKINKNPIISDNKYGDGNGEEALGGIEVRLLNKTNEVIATTTTAEKDGDTVRYINNEGKEIEVQLSKGQYLFTKLDDGTNYIPVGTDYKIEIDYDGITYEAIEQDKDDDTTLYNKNGYSKIVSEEDYGLADGTTTISGTEHENQSKTNGGYIINYTLQEEENIPDKAIYSKIEKGGKQVFVTAGTKTYLKAEEDWKSTWKDENNDGIGEINLNGNNTYAFDINFGLNKKFFDLNLGTDVASAKVEINDKSQEYSYNQILDGMLDEYLEKVYKTSDNAIDYNLYLYHSDYNYRISDYKVPGSDGESSGSDGGSLGDPYGESYTSTDPTRKELQVYVTYRLQINNQSTKNSKEIKVKYKFDEGYTYVPNEGADGIELLKEDDELIITVKNLGGGDQRKIDLTFQVEKNNDDGTFVKAPSDTSKYTNTAEIVSYSTAGRLVDADSAPGNTFLEENEPTDRREDDTDTANGIIIRFKEDSERSISGKVFEDSNKDSAQNSDEEAVNDVIVQLIELVEIDNKQYEYIWQETVAGSDTVKTTARNGYTGESYIVENEDGEYKFTERIIPGNYIVRFIYGDGTTYDITGNTLKYNGEDYKSTYAKYDYNAEWYNNTEDENSKAVDNEARRLKVMSYAVNVTGDKGKSLQALDNPTGVEEQQKILEAYNALQEDDKKVHNFKDVQKGVMENTWMCAETLKINVSIDESASVTFKNVNLGLMERPKTKLVLEKHITGLTIKPVESGVKLIANATADIKNILDEGEVKLNGQKDVLSAIKSTRGERGYWKVETDITELAQGADAYITYTYVIKNEGDDDYLSSDLINEYITNIDGYTEHLSILEGDVKNQLKSKEFTKGTYLTEAYYKNVTLPDTQKVLASVEQLQEALNSKVKFVDSTTDFEKDERDENKKYAYYNTDGDLVANDANIKEIITSKTGTNKLNKGERDTSKKLVVSVGLSASELENGGVYDSYIAEITYYTNAAGRRDQSTPANLSYVHSEDTRITLDSENSDTNKKYNEEDEFWAERFVITKPTGEDKLTPVQITIITVSAVAILGVGIILIKKFVLKK